MARRGEDGGNGSQRSTLEACNVSSGKDGGGRTGNGNVGSGGTGDGGIAGEGANGGIVGGACGNGACGGGGEGAATACIPHEKEANSSAIPRIPPS